MKRKSACRTHSFTLVEIIAVLIILGILLAVAVPKYFSLVQEAKMRACDGALSSAYSICSLVYARRSLELAAAPTVAQMQADVETELTALEAQGDFDIAANYSVDTGIGFTVNGQIGSKVEDGWAVGTWLRPTD